MYSFFLHPYPFLSLFFNTFVPKFEKMIPTTDQFFMNQALKEARKAATSNEVPVGAVITVDGKIVAKAHNQTRLLNDPTAHAELLAITIATGALGAKYLVNSTLYVTLEPCAMCAGAIGWAQIPTLVFGANDPKKGFLTFAPLVLHPKTTVRKGVLEEQCSEILKKFFEEKR